MTNQIAAGAFKAQCLHLMDEVSKTKKPLTITKRGVPIAQLVPINREPSTLFGAQRNTVTIVGDIISPMGEEWDANQ